VEEVTDQELIEKAIDGMLSGLDPHSGFMNEEVFQEMQMDTEGKFGGLGIEITMEEGFVKVIAPIEDTPAYDAGVLAGDYIIQIDETPVFGLTLNEAVELMRGKKGEPIVITISRANTEPFEIEIIRDYIKIRSVKSEVLNNIGYLRITSFNEQTESGLLNAIKKIEQENKIKGYVLDVRSNPGGLLTQAVKVTDIFLERGEIVSTRGRDKKDIRRYRAKKSDRTNGKPLVVIIDGGSASASEIVAGALQDHKRAIIIGTQSFGKGSVQTIIPFQVSNSDNLTGIRLTTARYYTPSGESIQGKGIVPDIIIEQGEFESFDYKRFSESDLKDSLDKNNEEDVEENEDNELSEFEKRLEIDYQLRRAFDLVQGVSLFNETQE
jgi:carboxyl-terminal processing protease